MNHQTKNQLRAEANKLASKQRGLHVGNFFFYKVMQANAKRKQRPQPGESTDGPPPQEARAAAEAASTVD